MKLQHNHAEMKIARIREQCEGIKTYELDGEVDAKAGQFVMLYDPESTENPFTVSYDSPLHVMVKARGEDDGDNSFTNRLFRKQTGDKLQVTGPVGNGFFDVIKPDGCKVLFAITGGCGCAAMPLLDKQLEGKGIRLLHYFGAKTPKEIPSFMLEPESCVFDMATEDGGFRTKGSVLDAFGEEIERRYRRYSKQYRQNGVQTIVCGPRKMLIAVGERLKQSIPPENIIVSLEPYMKCGRGVCGSCEVDGYHVCTDGSNFRYSDVMDAPDFREYRRRKSGVLEPI